MKEYQVIWTPQPKQAQAMSCPATELFFGGAAGGGKSDFMLGDFLAGARLYGKHWKGILFRQTTSELEELQNRATELFEPLGAVFKGTGTKSGSNMWKFPNGATLKMRYLESEKDVRHYQGHEYTWIGIDELGNYPTPYCWTFMKSRLRSRVGVPCYIRGSANPGGVGHGWIKQRFMDDHEPNKIFWIESKDDKGNLIKNDKGKVIKDSVVFIPSRLEDNQILMKNDPAYESRLMSLPSYLARAMRYGDWSVFDGQIFDVFRYDRHVVKPFPLNSGEWFKFCAMDWGFGKPFSIGWYAVNSIGRVVRYRELYGCKPGEYNVGVKRGSSDVAKEAWELSLAEGVTDMVADPAVWNTQDDKPSVAENFKAVGWNMIKANNDRVNGLERVYSYLKEVCDEYDTPLLTIFPNCTDFIRTIPLLSPDKNHPEDVDTKLEDHIYDEVRYALMSDFVANPTQIIAKENGKWNIQKVIRPSYDPFSY